MPQNIKFQTKLIISFSAIMVAAIVVLGLFMNSYIFKKIENRITENVLQLSVKISQQLDYYFKEIDRASIKLITNDDLLNILSVINRSKKPPDDFSTFLHNRELDKISLDTITFTSIPTSHIYIYNKDYKQIYSYNPLKGNFDLMKNNPNCIKMLYNREITIYANNIHTKKYNGYDSFSLVRCVFDLNGNNYGYVEVQEDYSMFDDICNIGSTGQVYIIDQRKNFIYPVSSINDKDKDFILQSKLNANNGFLICKNGNLYFFNKSSYTGLTVIIKYSIKTVFASLDMIKNTTLTIIAIVTLFSLLTIYFISSFLVNPIRKLRDSIIKVSFQNMNLNFDETIYHDEINLLNNAFQNLLNRLKSSMERELALNKEEAEARFTALQAQIAPHFIHNILYIISIKAEENKTREVMSMCKQLSNMLRYIVDSPFSEVTLDEEIAYTLNYLSLQEKNFEDFLHYEIDVQDEAKSIVLPRLVIQPFVENSFQHGFKSIKPPWRILIQCKIEMGFWSISISDNGTGIPSVKTKEIFTKLSLKKVSAFTENKKDGNGMCSMGIINTVMRLRLMYHEELQFNIFRNEYGGSTILIKGPTIVKRIEK